MNDISMSAPPACGSTCPAAYVNQHTAAMLDQHTAAMLDGSQYEAFGHGTMVMGVIHLVAPTAKLLPVKSFSANGNGSLSNIIAGIYYAVQNHASVINMSFDMLQNSTELTDAINYANSNHVILVASPATTASRKWFIPRALQRVMGVASTNNQDQRSSFSNYGNQIVWVAAPGEGVITTYPFGLYAAGWGTSFSSPFVAGTADLVSSMQSHDTQNQAAWGIAHAQFVGFNMGNGRLNVNWTLSALNPLQGLLHLEPTGHSDADDRPNAPAGASDSPNRIEGISEAPSSLAIPATVPRQWSGVILRIKQMEEQALALRTSLICAFNQLLDLKDLNTGVHSTRLAEWALHVAGELGLDESSPLRSRSGRAAPRYRENRHSRRHPQNPPS